MSRQQIVMVSHYYPPHVGGLEVVAQAQAKSLGRRDHDVAVVTADVEGTPRTETDGGVIITRVKAWHYFDKRFGIPFLFFSPALYTELKHKIQLSSVVHIHDVFYMSSWVAGYLAWKLKKPLFLTQHVGMVDHPSGLVRFVQKAVYSTAGQYLFKRANRVIVYNRNVYKFVKQQGVPEARIIELRNGIDTSYFTPVAPEQKRALRRKHGLPEDQPICLYVGRLVPKKGYLLLLGAAQKSTHRPLAVFVGPGKYPENDQYNARFLGPRQGEALRELYQLADVCVIPSKDELFTLVHQEAMACGLPIITTDEPGYRSYQVDRKRMALVKRSQNAITQAIDTVLSDRDLQWQMSNYSRQLAVEKFDWERNIETLAQLYYAPQEDKA